MIVPAVLPTSYDDLLEKLALFAHFPAERVQIDVVDGRFAQPESWPYTSRAQFAALVKSGAFLPHVQETEYEVDLMCLDAEAMAGAWVALGAKRLTLHLETATDMPRLVRTLRRSHGGAEQFSVGMALNLSTELSLLEPVLGQVDYVQFMGIAKIGRQGELFDARVLDRVRAFRKTHPQIPLQVDGGITLERAKELAARGVNDFIAGSAILRARDPQAAFAAFSTLESPYGV